jgi:hypothetical protein
MDLYLAHASHQLGLVAFLFGLPQFTPPLSLGGMRDKDGPRRR